MIAILSTCTYNQDAPLILRLKPDSNLDNLTRRVTRTATLEGGCVLSDLGFSYGDLSFTLKANLTEDEDARLSRLIRSESELTLSCRHGLFLGAIERRTGIGGDVTLSFLVSDKIRYIEPEPPPAETFALADAVFICTDGSGGWVYIDSDATVSRVLGANNGVEVYTLILFEGVISPTTSAEIEFSAIKLSGASVSVDIRTALVADASLPASKDELDALTLSDAVRWDFSDNISDGDVLTSPDITDICRTATQISGWTGNILIVLDGSPTPLETNYIEFDMSTSKISLL